MESLYKADIFPMKDAQIKQKHQSVIRIQLNKKEFDRYRLTK